MQMLTLLQHQDTASTITACINLENYNHHLVRQNTLPQAHLEDPLQCAAQVLVQANTLTTLLPGAMASGIPHMKSLHACSTAHAGQCHQPADVQPHMLPTQLPRHKHATNKCDGTWLVRCNA